MVTIPMDFAKSIKQIIEWHIQTYMPERDFNNHLNRILGHFFERNMVDGIVEIEEKELKYVDECLSNATNNIPECGVQENEVWDIYNWIVTERKNLNV